MTSNEILKADVLDILFDNRNKLYGAYVLRKTYNNRLFMALGISLSSILLFFLLARMYRSPHSIIDPVSKDEIVVDHVIPPDIKKADPVIPKRLTPPQVRTEKLSTINIKNDKLVNTTIPDQNSLSISEISNFKSDGVIAGDIAVLKTPEVPVQIKDDPRPVPNTNVVQKEPEFPGGEQAWLNFLQKNLVAPGELEPGEKKMVAIKFQVSPEGTVTNFEVVQSAGRSFDNEVIRVLRKMPRWKPAIQNGQPVARAFTQPVTFVGIEQ
ncbi:MAG: energy transducer TonB [Flavisolibacter sp.]